MKRSLQICFFCLFLINISVWNLSYLVKLSLEFVIREITFVLFVFVVANAALALNIMQVQRLVLHLNELATKLSCLSLTRKYLLARIRINPLENLVNLIHF